MLQKLTEDRSLPLEAFKGYDIGYYNNEYILPIKNESMKICDIRHYKLRGQIMSTPGCKTFPFEGHNISLNDTIYICEGEWDAIALNYAIAKNGAKSSLAIGVPGANNFKGEWIPLFTDKIVYVCYDNDIAGIEGMLKVEKKLKDTAKSLSFIDWNEKLPNKYDVRDFVVSQITEHDFEFALNKISFSHKLGETAIKATISKTTELPLKPVALNELFSTFKKWLHLPSIDPLCILFGTLMANKLPGDPIWLFAIAPPGGAKSELLGSLSDLEEVKALSSMTPRTLVSGVYSKSGRDPSLLPKLNGKILIIKDFTTIMSMHYTERDEIFGVLRDVYDGYFEKVFGNGVVRSYTSKFGIIAGVTTAIETFNLVHSSLGERFLKYRITGNWDRSSEDAKISKALANMGSENEMHMNLRSKVVRFVRGLKSPDQAHTPIIPAVYANYIGSLAKLTARLRGVVERDPRTDRMLFKPTTEVGTRLARQLAKLGIGIAIFLNKGQIDDEVYRLMRRVALDTIPDINEDVVHAVWKLTRHDPATTTTEIIETTRMPHTTVTRVLNDMVLLKTMTKQMDDKRVIHWKLAKNIQEYIRDGRVYEKHT